MATDKSVGSRAGEITGGSLGYEPVPRPAVMCFARAMEARLRLNDHKEGWANIDAH